MLDEYLIGSSTRNSPEADVPVVLKKKRELRLGGAANVAFNLHNLGINPYLISVIGDDTAGKEIQKLLAAASISAELTIDNERPTTVKQRVVDESFNQFIRIDTESTQELGIVIETAIRDRLLDLINNTRIDGLVIQDYDKGVVTKFLIKVIHDLSSQYGLPIFVDPKHRNFSLLATKCSLFKPNIKELGQQLNKELAPESKNVLAALASIKYMNAEMIFVTLGERGIFYYHKASGDHGIVPGIKVEKADVSGAGDSVLATLIWSYYDSGKAPIMAEIANVAGAKVCSYNGVSTIYLQDL